MQFILRRCHADQAALAIQQQWSASFQQQDRRPRADHSRDAQGTGDNGAVGGGSTLCSDNTGDPVWVQPGDVGRANFGHHQYVRLLGLSLGVHTAQLRQHAAADVA
ncbi:hypothetical protein D3C80_1194860 [compost metagenome]